MIRTFLMGLMVVFIVTGCAPMPPRQVLTQLEQKPLLSKRPRIVIDAGHGGQDNGTQSLSKPICLEKSFNLSTALMLDQYLRQMGFQTILTRSDDTFIPLSTRATIANTNKATLFVSVHYNAAESTKAEGIEVFFYDSKDKRAESSKELAESVIKNFTENAQVKVRGVKKGDFAVIRETNMPAILVEGGFLSNDSELKKIKDPRYQKILAYSIAKSIKDYFE